jgi:hypothetical protein
MNPLDHITPSEIDGIPVFTAPLLPGLPFVAGMVFRVGRCDETLRTSGITHLVEHLALPEASTGRWETQMTPHEPRSVPEP